MIDTLKAPDLTAVMTLHTAGHLSAAIAGYQALLKEEPSATVYTNLGVALRTQGHLDAAIAAYHRALALDENYLPALSNLGGGLRALGRLPEAIPLLERALTMNPDFAAAHHNLGLVYMDDGQPLKAIACFETAMRLEPHRVDSPFDRATCLLQSGQLQAGFAAYECRFAYEPRLQRHYTQPAWQGQALAGQTLYLYSEQGFGDTLQFIRYVALIEKAGGRLILECPAPLKRLMQSLSVLDQVITPDEPSPNFDTHCALLSLPYCFDTTLETIPAPVVYDALPRLDKLLPPSTKKRVGLVWASGHSDVGVRARSIPLTAFAALLAKTDYEFYSFQKGPAVQDLKASGFETLVHNLNAVIQDFADTAQYLKQMDLLISADTAIVHLAGSLKIPTWVLLPYGSEWRWFLESKTTPWYPSVRLFRKGDSESWESLVQSVRQALSQAFQEASAQPVSPAFMNPALYYHPEGFSTQGTKLMGRQAAGESFLKAWCQFQSEQPVIGYGTSNHSAQAFVRQVQAYSPSDRPTDWVDAHTPERLKEQGLLLLPGPGLSEWAWQRRSHGLETDYSVCGLTHTTASDRVMETLGELVTVPTQPWDALICTSHSVKAMVDTVIEDYAAYLQDRFPGARIHCPVQRPVIPLGLDVSRFTPTDAKKAGHALRQALGIASDATVFLFMGRLSFHAKAHPHPMLVALEQAAQASQKPVTLILAGWYANAAIEAAFQEAARLLCPSVQVLSVDGRKPPIRETIWAASDVFTSLSDNIQETFGLTPLEAKAAGLPVVVSDWDGYRETVRHEQDGYLIPTVMPPAGSGNSMAQSYAIQQDSYDVYLGKTCQSIAVDIQACAQAYQRLIEYPELRKQLGAQGQADARARFDWPVIFQQYQALWQELAQMRSQAQGHRPTQPLHPLRQDPFHLFASYPTHRLNPETWVKPGPLIDWELPAQLRMNQIAPEMLYPLNHLQQLVVSVPVEGIPLAALQQAIQCQESDRFYRSIGWLLKLGALSLGQSAR